MGDKKNSRGNERANRGENMKLIKVKILAILFISFVGLLSITYNAYTNNPNKLTKEHQ